jgi:hypothetical protein
MTPSRKLHKNDKLWGAVAEALVAAYALYLQVKCALGVDSNGRIGGMVRLHSDQIPSSPKFVYVFCLLDRRKMELTRIWVIPSAEFYKHAYRTSLRKEMIQFNSTVERRATTVGTPTK